VISNKDKPAHYYIQWHVVNIHQNMLLTTGKNTRVFDDIGSMTFHLEARQNALLLSKKIHLTWQQREPCELLSKLGQCLLATY
jgi:hypothetical protein